MSIFGTFRWILPCIITIVVFGAFVGFAALDRFYAYAELQQSTQNTAKHVGARVQDRVQADIDAFLFLRESWDQQIVLDQEHFESAISARKKSHPDLMAVNWIDPDGLITWVCPLEENEAAIGKDLTAHPVAGQAFRAARESGTIQLSPPLQLYQGAYGFAAYVPINGPDSPDGFLNIVFRCTPLFQGMFDVDDEEQFELCVMDGEEFLYSTLADANDGENRILNDPAMAQNAIEIFNRTWHLNLVPTDAFAAAHTSRISNYLLLYGAIISVLFGIISAYIRKRRLNDRDKEQRLKAIADHLPGVLYTYVCSDGGQWTLQFLSSHAEHLFGSKTFHQLQSDTIAILDLFEDCDPALLNFQDGPLSQAFESDHQVQTDQGLRWMHNVIRASYGPRKTTIIHGVIQDAQERKSAEIEVSETRQRLELYLEHAADAMFVHDLDGRIHEVNHRACESVGIEASELRGMSLQDITPNWSSRRFQNVMYDLKQQTTIRLEGWHHHRDGTAFPVETSVGQVTIGGTTMVLAICRDITEQRRARNELQRSRRRLMDAQRIGRIGDWELDPATGELTWSDEVFRLFGEQVVAKIPTFDQWLELMSNFDADQMRKAVQRAKEYAESSSVELVYKRNDEWCFAQALIRPIENTDGDVHRIIGTLQDITERKQAEIERENATLRIEQTRFQLVQLLAATATVQSAATTDEALHRIVNAVRQAGWKSVSAHLFKDWKIVGNAFAGMKEEHVQIMLNSNVTPQTRAKRFGPEHEQFKISRSYFVPGSYVESKQDEHPYIPSDPTDQGEWTPSDIAYVPLYAHDGSVMGCISLDEPVDGCRPDRESFEYLEFFADLCARTTEQIVLREERARMLAEIGESDTQFRQLTASINEVVWLQEIGTHKTLYVSPAFEQIWGVSIDEFMRDTQIWARSLHENDRSVVLEHFSGDEPNDIDIEYRIRRPDGSIRWIRDRASVIHDETGQPTRLAGVAEDITDRKLQDARDELQQQRLRRLNKRLANLTGGLRSHWGNLDECIRFITQESTGALDIEFAGVWFYHDDFSRIENVDMHVHSTGEHKVQPSANPENCAPYLDALKAERVLAIDDALQNSIVSCFVEPYFIPNNITATIDAPIRVGGKLIGIVTFEHVRTSRRWTIEEQSFAGAVADLVATAVEGARRREAEEQTRADRIFFEETLDKQVGLTLRMECDEAGEFVCTLCRGRLAGTYGLDSSQVVGANLNSIRKHGHDPDTIRPYFQRALDGERTSFEGISPDGTRHFLAQLEAVDSVGDHAQPKREIIASIIDITERRIEENARLYRDQILQAISMAAERFLQAADWEDVIDDVLGLIAPAADAHRAYVFKNETRPDGELCTTCIHEWCDDGLQSKIDDPRMCMAPYRTSGFEEWPAILESGACIAICHDELSSDKQALLDGLAVESMAVVPIFVDNNWWGFVGIDDCKNQRTWTDTEIGAIRIAAGIIGAGIQRTNDSTALSRQHTFLREVIDSIPSHVFTKDPAGRYTLINRSFAETFDRPVEDIIGLNVAELLDDHELAARMTRDDERVLRTMDILHAQDQEITDGAGTRRWFETVKRAISDDDGVARQLLGVATDITERKLAEQHQALMMRELDHRVRNNLASLLSLTHQTIACSASLEEFSERFVGRLTAMSRSHDALAGSQWSGLDLRTGAAMVLEAFVGNTPGRLELQGEDVAIQAESATPLCMVLHELATNAVKYGAWSSPIGTVQLNWQVHDDAVEICWIERDGPVVEEPAKTGTGTDLIRGFIEFQLRGQVSIEFKRIGVEVTLRLPIAQEANEQEAELVRHATDRSDS